MPRSPVLIGARNSAFGHALAGMLRAEHHEPTLVASAAELLTQLPAGGFGLCLLQDELTDLDGLAVCEQVCQSDHPPVIFFSHRAGLERPALEKGARGFLRLPCRSRDLRAVLDTAIVRKKTILLVDDSRVIHSIVEEVLQNEGFELLHAFDGAEGFDKALATRPDLIISDIDMPVLDGFGFCRKVKETPATEHIPVLMQSTRGSGIDIDKGFDAGANDYLTKPVNPDELLSRVQQLLDHDTHHTRERILVVDDSKTIRNFMSQGLTQQGFEIETAANGQEGLAVALQKKPDLVVTDLEMPVMNGREMTRQLRKEEHFKDTPVIMLTASGSRTDQIKGRHAGVNAYLSKPFAPDKLVVLVEKFIAERKLLAERGELQDRNQFIREVFGRYMNDDVVNTLLESSDGLQLGGERRKVTILMSDLRGFSSISERLSPEEVVSMLNVYLEAMTDVIVRYGGTIDEFIGDAILTLFGAPISAADDAGRAVACALEMQLAMEAVNAHNREHDFPELEMGIGINTGEVVVGNIGSKKRAKYGIVGSHVNMTGRIESYTVGGQVLISEATLGEIAQEVRTGRRMEIEPKGAKQPIAIHEVTGIGEPFNVFLAGEDEALTPLAAALAIQYTVLEEKFAGRTLFDGSIVAFSAKDATVDCEVAPAVMANLKLQLRDPGSGAVLPDVYGKVMEHSADDARRFLLRFTSVPEETAVVLRRILDQVRAVVE